MKEKIKSFFNKIGKKIKSFFIKIWELIKSWFEKTAKPWLKKSWMEIVNMLILFIAYDKLSDALTYPVAETLVGLWLFVLLAYYIFWKLLGAEKMFKK